MYPTRKAMRLLSACLLTGTIGALAMMPFGKLFSMLGLRIGHYGPKFADWLFGSSGSLLLLVQHFVLGWLSALPLLLLFAWPPAASRPLISGGLYGLVYYLLVNSLGLPLMFGDPLPWQLGLATVLPSLVVHLVFGLSVAWAARSYIAASAR
jgi:uncharacterized membrane protein YagU involved in acid resistance